MVCMIRSENTLTHVFKAFKSIIMLHLRHFQNESYIPQLFTRSSHLENPSVLTGWWSGIGIVLSERSIHILKFIKTTRKIAPIGSILRLCHNFYFMLHKIKQ